MFLLHEQFSFSGEVNMYFVRNYAVVWLCGVVCFKVIVNAQKRETSLPNSLFRVQRKATLNLLRQLILMVI